MSRQFLVVLLLGTFSVVSAWGDDFSPYRERGTGGWTPPSGQSGFSSPYSAPYSAISYVSSPGSYGARGSDGEPLEKVRVVCPGTGSFQWVYAVGNQCVPFTGEKNFVEFIDRTFNKCVAEGSRAAGFPSSHGQFKGTVRHVGCEGDSRHRTQSVGSLHNIGRALDVKAIEVNGRVISYEAAVAQSRTGLVGKEYNFYETFRQCWSREGKAFEPSCRSGAQTTRAGYFGSLGWEGGHPSHMHLSLPFCGSQKASLGTKVAEFHRAQLLRFAFFWNAIRVRAQEVEAESKPKVAATISLKNKGSVKAITEFVGEPVDAPVLVDLEAKCTPQEKPRLVLEDFSVCDFDNLKVDAKSGELILTYKTSIFKDGIFTCGKPIVKKIPAPCSKK